MMISLKHYLRDQKGFVLITMLFMMVLMAVTAGGINRRSAIQAKIADNQSRSAQLSLGQLAAVEHASWQLIQNPGLRTDAAGEDYVYNNITYNRKVLDSTISCYTDTVTISITAPDGLKPLTATYRFNLGLTDFYLIADTENHRIKKIDAATPANIHFIAGTGSSGDSGDGGPAEDARLNEPKGLFVDTAGNIYIADTENHRIKKIDAAYPFNINIIAGMGPRGDSGDGGPAVNARLDTPKGVFGDAAGNIYIADTGNHRIKMIDAAAPYNIHNIAGNGSSGDSGDGGPAVNAQLNEPGGVFLDAAGNIYIADTKNHRIKMIDAAAPYNIHNIAGNGSSGDSGDGGPAVNAQLNEPSGIFVDAAGNIYIADTGNHRIKMVDAAAPYNIHNIAGTGSSGDSGDGGPAVNARLNRPEGVFVDAAGNIYIADTKNHRIKMIDAAAPFNIHNIAGTGSQGDSGDCGQAAAAALKNPSGIYIFNAAATPPPCPCLKILAEMY